MGSFQQANRRQAYLNLLLDGQSGGGKSHSGLLMLQGILSITGGKAAVVDSERGIEKKPNELLTNVDVANVSDKTLDNYCKLIDEAVHAGYKALMLDGITHPWHELVEEIDKLARTKYAGNTFRAWSEGTPKQRRFTEAIVFSPIHIIATSRVKTDWVVEANDKGKATPRKVGLATEQGKSLEYEFDIWMRMSDENIGTVLKDRFAMGLQGQMFDKPGADFAVRVLNHLMKGDDSDILVANLFSEIAFTPEQQRMARTKYPITADLLKHLQDYKQKVAVAA